MTEKTEFSKNDVTELKLLGIYQIIGGILGLVLLFFNGVDSIAKYPIGFFLFSFSIYAGNECYRQKDKWHVLTIINQSMQALSIVIASVLFNYVSGAAINIYFDLTESLKFGLDFNLSDISIGTKDDSENLIIGFNFIALYIIYLVEKIRKGQR